MIGQTVGSYSILAKLGEGGMGQVFRAHDSKLGRDVALKILPSGFASDLDRLARFEREARLLATLNHPNIAQVFDAGKDPASGSAYIAMELVGGEDLKALIARGPLAPADAVPIARQIALALEAAHEQGIVHRDLKPANVRIRDDGTVKVLDFGLAKAMDADPMRSGKDAAATITSPAVTQHGIILGTAAYMSPEQAKGRAVDKRADIWAFGLVLRELVTGKQLFGGETVAETLGQIFQQPINDADLPAKLPRALRDLIARCLERDPAQRLRDIGEARILLARTDVLAPASLADASSPTRRGIGPTGVASVTALVALAAIAGWWLKPAPQVADIPPRKLDLVARNLRTGLNPNIAPVLSPDGMRLLYATDTGLFVRGLNDLEGVALSNTDGAQYLAWSPDSRNVAYIRNAKLWTMDLGAGTAHSIADFTNAGSGGLAWNDAGEIGISGNDQGFYVVSASGGQPRMVVGMDAGKESDDHEVEALPGGRGWLVTVHRSEGTDTIALIAGGKRKYLLSVPGEILRAPRYSSTGHLIFQKALVNPGIWAVRFSLDELQTVGEPFAVLPDVTQPSVSADGETLAFVRQPETIRHFAWVDRAGAIQTVGESMQIASHDEIRQFRLAPDGRTVAFSTDQSAPDLWVYDLERGIRTRVTEKVTDPASAGIASPVWTSDSRRLYFAAFQGKVRWSIFSRRADASDGLTTVAEATEFLLPFDISPDGELLVYGQSLRDPHIMVRRLDGTGVPKKLVSSAPFSQAVVSPDGQWLAYAKKEGGSSDVVVQPFSGAEGRWTISTGNGSFPFWAAGGKQLWYRTPSGVMSVDVTTKNGAFASSKPTPLIALPPESGLSRAFEASKDGTRLLMVRIAGQDRMTVIINLRAELARLQAASER